MDNIKELKTRAIRVLLVFIAFFIIGLYFHRTILDYMKAIIPQDFLFIIPNPIVSFSILMNIAFLFAIILTMPYLIYNLIRFIAPALTQNERGKIKVYFSLSLILFFAGVMFNILIILGMGIPFLVDLSQSMGLTILWNMEEYINFIIISTLIFGLIFQFPIILHLLIKAGIVDLQTLRGNRLPAFAIIILLSAIVTPTTDAITMLLLAIPLFLMYEGVIRMNGGEKI